MKLRLLSVFVKSIAAANCFRYTLHVMFDAIYGGACAAEGADVCMGARTHARPPARTHTCTHARMHLCMHACWPALATVT